MSTVSLIIVSRNVAPYLDRCLSSAAHDPLWRRGQMEAVVVDNASSDATLAMLREKHPRANVVANRDNRGFAAACNQGIRASSGTYPIVLNPDTVVGDGTLSALVRFAADSPGAGIVGPMVVNPDGSLQPSRRRFPSYSSILFARKSPLAAMMPEHPLARRYVMADVDGSMVQEVEALAGACLLLRREMLQGTGLFDERYFMYLEDIDLCYRAHREGWTVTYLPTARVVHYWGLSTVQEQRAMEQHHRRSMYLFFLKHHRPNQLQRLYLMAALAVHSLVG